MNFATSRGVETPVLHEERVAALTAAAYSVALRHCATSKWIDVQLELWRAFSAAAAGGRAITEERLAVLSELAYRIVLPYGRRVSFLALELELHQALCQAADCIAWA